MSSSHSSNVPGVHTLVNDEEHHELVTGVTGRKRRFVERYLDYPETQVREFSLHKGGFLLSKALKKNVTNIVQLCLVELIF